MALTPSKMVPLGMPAPAFALQNVVDGRTVSLADFAGREVLVVMFICNHCPYVIHIRDGLAAFGRDMAEKNVGVVAISANDPAAYPADSPENMKTEAERAGYGFAYLFDATQEVAKAYGAVCTPDFFVFDAHRQLVYRGQFDGARPRNADPVTGADLRRAVDAVLAKTPIPEPQTPSIGCSIKWQPGNEPTT